MSRFLLALRCFFAVLLRRRLPNEALPLEFISPVSEAAEKRQPAPALPPKQEPALVESAALPAKAASTPAPMVDAVKEPAPPAVLTPPVAAAPVDTLAICHRGAVQLLAVLQREGRLLDFLMEDIDSYADAQIGAAVRDIHRGCKKALGEHFKPRPIRSEPDEAVVRIPEGYDPSQIRLVGRVTGRPPFEGTLRHHGWQASHIQLSDLPASHDPTVICPAEVEIGA